MGTRLQDCHLISFFHQNSEKGIIVSAHSQEEIPFEVQRVYYLNALSAERKCGQHANRHNQQVMVAVQGHFEVRLMDGEGEQTFVMDSPQVGLLVREGIWREVKHFSPDAICLVFCSERFEEEDYMKDWDFFLKMKNF